MHQYYICNRNNREKRNLPFVVYVKNGGYDISIYFGTRLARKQKLLITGIRLSVDGYFSRRFKSLYKFR